MRMTAEIRWFWAGRPPPAFAAWFRDAGPSWGSTDDSKMRIDEYVRDPAQTVLGIKRRGGSQGIEIKGLISTRATVLELSGCACPVGLWGKWSATFALDEGHLIKVAKQRWMRRFAVGGGRVSELAASESRERASGCDAELTLLDGPDGLPWWTVGFEAFGAIDGVEDDLAATVAVVQRRSPPLLPPGQASGYPGWLAARGW